MVVELFKIILYKWLNRIETYHTQDGKNHFSALKVRIHMGHPVFSFFGNVDFSLVILTNRKKPIYLRTTFPINHLSFGQLYVASSIEKTLIEQGTVGEKNKSNTHYTVCLFEFDRSYVHRLEHSHQ